eukprot:645612-Pelagomonas_calceolata.AAC.2
MCTREERVDERSTCSPTACPTSTPPMLLAHEAGGAVCSPVGHNMCVHNGAASLAFCTYLAHVLQAPTQLAHKAGGAVCSPVGRNMCVHNGAARRPTRAAKHRKHYHKSHRQRQSSTSSTTMKAITRAVKHKKHCHEGRRQKHSTQAALP